MCNNTLAVAIGDSKDAVKVRHNTTFGADAVKRQLSISVSSWDTFMYRMKMLSERKVNHVEAESFFRQLFTDPRPDLSIKHNEHAMSKTLAIYGGRGRGAELVSSKGAALELLNSITEYVDHEHRAHNIDNRLDSAWFGRGAAIKQHALDRTLAICWYKNNYLNQSTSESIESGHGTN